LSTLHPSLGEAINERQQRDEQVRRLRSMVDRYSKTAAMTKHAFEMMAPAKMTTLRNDKTADNGERTAKVSMLKLHIPHVAEESLCLRQVA
jgi:hypothetical protein